MSERFRSAVTGCSRCGGEHEAMEFVAFTRQPVFDADGDVWTHWSMCPERNEPVLCRTVVEPVPGDPISTP